MRKSVSNPELGLFIKKAANDLGFSACGISQIRTLDEHRTPFLGWINEGHHGEMSYLERNLEKRLNPALLVPGAQTVLSVIQNYYRPERGGSPDAWISRYAAGTDYHRVLRDKLYRLAELIRTQTELGTFRVFVDSAPVMERVWARESGLGWIGQNGCLINRQAGSFFFIGEIISDLNLPSDAPTPGYCGTCRRCLDACPTGALLGNGQIDARRCISYLTIESRGVIDSELAEKLDNWVFGCDICQEVCPWNTRSSTTNDPQLAPRSGAPRLNRKDWLSLDEETFQSTYAASPLSRAGLQKIQQTIGQMGPYQPSKEFRLSAWCKPGEPEKDNDNLREGERFL